MYVNMMIEEKDNDKVEDFPMIDEIFNRNVISKEQAIRESMALVSDLTNYASLVLGSSAYNAKIRKIQLVRISDNLAVIILVTDQGYVESKKIIIPEDINPRDIENVIVLLNDVLFDCPISHIDKKLKEHSDTDQLKQRVEYYDELVSVFVRAITNMVQDKYFMSGQSKMMDIPEFQDVNKLKNVMRAMEEREVLKLINLGDEGIRVRIGAENELSAMKDCTIISVPYNDKDGVRGALAVIGPKRMEYQKVIPLLEYIAKYMHRL